MTTGKKSHTANHPIGIRKDRITSRAMAGSGNRGRHASLKVAAVGSMTTNDAPSSFARACSSEVSRCRTCVLSLIPVDRSVYHAIRSRRFSFFAGRDAKSQSGICPLTLNPWLCCANRLNHNGRCSASFAAAGECSDESERCTCSSVCQLESVSQPVPTMRVGGSSGSGTRSGVVSRASETNTDDREVKRVRFTESRGQKRQGEDVEELAAKAEEQHLDADVEVSTHKTWRVEDVVADAADAAPEQRNSFVQSKTEVFEKIEESLRPLCKVEDLNDEIMELCILSNELNACEAIAILNPSKFASCATRLGLRQGFAVDLTTARANGTMWDLSLEDDKAELRRVQNREQPELLVGSPPSDEFSSLLSKRAAPREISKLKTEKIAPRIRACVQSCKLQVEMRKHSVHEHPEVSSSWEMPEVQSLIHDPRVYSIDGPMCRWSLRTRGLRNKTEFMRKRTRWITSSKEIAEVLHGDGRWTRDKRLIHMTGKSETVSEYFASLVVAMMKAI